MNTRAVQSRALPSNTMAMQAYSTIEVNRYFNPLYTYLFLREFSSIFSKNRTSELERYKEIFNDKSEIVAPSIDDTTNAFIGTLPQTIKGHETIDSLRSVYSSETPSSRALSTFLKMIFDTYQKYDMNKMIDQPDKLIVFLDFHESNTETLKQYFGYDEFRTELREIIPENVKREKQSNIFFLKVLIKNDRFESDLERIIEKELSRLEEYLQISFLNSVKTPGNRTQQTAFREIVLFTNLSGILNYDYFKENTVKKKYQLLIHTKIFDFLKDNKSFNLQYGIQRRRVDNDVKKSPLVYYKFQELLKQNNISFKRKSSATNTTNKPYIVELYFFTFIFKRICEEYFNPKLLRQSFGRDDAYKRKYITVFYHYTTPKKRDRYKINRIVTSNSSYLYNLELSNLSSIKFQGYFLSRGRFYVFRLTEIHFEGLDSELTDIFTVLWKSTRTTTSRFLEYFFKQFNGVKNSIIEDVRRTMNTMNIDTNINITSKQFIEMIYSLERDEENIQANRHKEPVTNLVKMLRQRMIDLYPESLNVIFLVLYRDGIKLRIDIKNGIHSIAVLEESNRSTYYEDKIYGILANNEPVNYYTKFSLNRIDPRLAEKRKRIHFDDNLIIKSNVLYEFLLERELLSNDKIEYNEFVRNLAPYWLLQVLNDERLLDELFDFTYQNYSKYIFLNKQSIANNENNFEYEQFKLKAIQSILEILFAEGVPFYVSERTNNKTLNTTSRGLYSTYKIGNVVNLSIIQDNITASELKDIVNIEYFKDRREYKATDNYEENNIDHIFDDTATVSELDSNSNKSSSILFSQGKKQDTNTVSFSSLLVSINKKSSLESIVILDLFLQPNYKGSNNSKCKTRRSRIMNKIQSELQSVRMKVNVATRKIRNRLKGQRKRSKLSSTKRNQQNSKKRKSNF